MSDQSTYVGPSLVAVGPTYPLWLYHPIFAPVLVDNVLQQNALIASDARWSVVPGAYSTPLVTVLSAFAAGCALDGITDDTTAFQALLNQVGTAPAAISITGSMFLASSITIPSNVQLIFAGNGRIKPAASVIVTMNGSYTAGAWQVWDTSAPASKITGLMKPSYGFLLPEHWGAQGDGITDDTVELQQTAKAAIDAGCLDIHLLPKKYLISDTVFATGTTGQSFISPRWYGSGNTNCIISYPNMPVGKAAFKFRGGSGRNPMLFVVNDVGFEGNAASIGVMFAGVDNMHAVNCRFHTNAVGVQFHNEDAGSFTEFCKANHCYFTSACTRHVQAKRTSGNDSHHGCGLINECLSQTSNVTLTFSGAFAGGETSGTLASVWPGLTDTFTVNFSSTDVREIALTNNATTATWTTALTAAATATPQITGDVFVNDSNGKPYNGWESVMIFPPVSAFVCAFNNRRSSAPPIDITGDIKCEQSTSTTMTLGLNNTVNFMGPICPVGVTTTTGANFLAGTMRRVKTSSLYADSSTLVTGYERSQIILPPTTVGTNSPLAINSNNPSCDRDYYVRITGSNYDYRYRLNVDHDGGGGAGYVNAQALRQFNTANWGIGGNSIAFSGTFAGTETSGTLTAAWTRPTGVYTILFSSNQNRPATFTQGSTAVTWTAALTLAATATVSMAAHPNPFSVATSGQLSVSNTWNMVATGTFAGTETSATLTNNWLLASGTYNITFSSGEIRPATLTNGSTAVTWTAALTLAGTTALAISGWPTAGITVFVYESQLSGNAAGSDRMQF